MLSFSIHFCPLLKVILCRLVSFHSLFYGVKTLPETARDEKKCVSKLTKLVFIIINCFR